MDVLLHPNNFIFSLSLAIMLLLAFIEVAMMFIGFASSDVLDNLLPDIDTPDAGGAATKALAWLRIGKLPAIIILVIFLFSFGVLGLTLQIMVDSLFSLYLPTIIIAPITLFLSLPLLRWLTGLLGSVFSAEESQSISRDGFVGQIATITVGESKKGSPAEAKFTDQYGTTHYLMVEPTVDDVSFCKGETVLIVGPEISDTAVFYVVEFERPNSV